MKRSLPLLGVLFGLSPLAHAQLVFSQPQQEIEPEPGQRWVTVNYPFENQGSFTLSVIDIESAHGRIEASLVNDKVTYRPGESGVIEVKYRNSGITEIVEAEITVYTDMHNDEGTPLNLDLLPAGTLDARAQAREARLYQETVNQMIEIDQQELTWTLDQIFFQTQSVNINIQGDQLLAIDFDEDRTWIPDFLTAEIVAIEPGRSYRLEITPDGLEDMLATLAEEDRLPTRPFQINFTLQAQSIALSEQANTSSDQEDNEQSPVLVYQRVRASFDLTSESSEETHNEDTQAPEATSPSTESIDLEEGE